MFRIRNIIIDMARPEYLLVSTAIYELGEAIKEVWCFEATLFVDIELNQFYLNLYPCTIPKPYRQRLLQNPETT